MEPVIKKEKTSAESRRRASTSSDVTKKKSSRACAPCRKRKVKCNGEQPCERCSKTDTECIFDKQHQKKETPKSIAENHEPRLKELEAFSVQFSRILDKTKVEPPFFYNPNQIQHPAQRGLTISTTGQGMYVPDTYLRTDRVPSIYKVGKNSEWNPIIQELLPRPEEVFYANKSKLLDIRHNLLDIYFRFIDPLIPILHKPSFLQSIQQQQPQSDLLLNAIYAVSSRWDTTVPSTGDQPRGWLYYQNAVKLIDLYSTPPRLSTVQAVFLLLKYNEHVRRPGFMWRTRFYFQIIVRMCKDLGLTHGIPSTKAILSIEIERRKRTFWAVFCYDVMMSIENGTAPNFEGVQLTLETPNVLTDEVPADSENVMHFILFTKVMRVQADILRFLRGKFSRLETTTVNMNDGEAEENNGDEKREYEEEEDEEEEDENENETSEASSLTIGKLAENLYSIMNLIISTCARPQKENFSYSICFLHLASHFSSILLHRPFMSANDLNSTHTLHCIESAGKIKSIVQLVLECDGIENIYCSIRGIQQMVHYLSAAVTVYKSIPDKSKELADTLYLARHLASISPATEVMSDSSLVSPSSLYGISTQGSSSNSNNSNNDDKMMVVDTVIKQEDGQKQQHHHNQQQQMQCQHQQMQYQQQQQQQHNNHYNNNNNNNNVNNNRSSEQSLKRKSLHLPDQPSSHQDHRALRVMRNRLSMPIMQDPSSSLLLSNYSQQQQQQQLQLQYAFQQQQPYDEPSTFIDQYDTEMTTIHPDHQQQQQPQSLLGLLFNDDESTMKDIPTL